MRLVKLLDGSIIEVHETDIEPGLGLVWVNIGLRLSPNMVLGMLL